MACFGTKLLVVGLVLALLCTGLVAFPLSAVGVVVGSPVEELTTDMPLFDGGPAGTYTDFSLGVASSNFTVTEEGESAPGDMTLGTNASFLYINQITGVVSGYANITGSFYVNIGAENENGTVWQNYTLVVSVGD